MRRANSLISSGQPITAHRIALEPPQAITAALSQLQPSFIVADKEGEPFDNDDTARAQFRAALAPVVLLRPSNTDEPG